MTWWKRLRRNPVAQMCGVLLAVFYLAAILAGFIGPYDPYDMQPNGALLPPTQVYWYDQNENYVGPHVYPTTQGVIDLETGEQKLIVDWDTPSPVRLFVQTDSGLHLFGTDGAGRWNILGTDDQGRDQLSRLLYGSRVSLSVGLLGILISFPLGLLVGGIAGYFGKWVDAILMRIVEVLMTVPTIYLLIALASVLSSPASIIPPELLGSAQRFLLIVVITSFVSWAGLARVIRGQVLSIKEREFVQSAKAMGASSFYIICRHILPQTATYVIISATLSIPSYIVAEAILSLIGLGIQQPDPSWGNMLSIATNASVLVLQPWLIVPPALLIILTVLSFNVLGDGLRDALDPRGLS